MRLCVAPFPTERKPILAATIPENMLSLDSLPLVDQKDAVFAFAMTFNGYEHFGSFEAAGENARTRSRATLVDVRNELFMAARASRHADNDCFIANYAELLPHFQRLLRDAPA